MRLLVHGMQSGGATAFTMFLAQRPDCLAFIDIPNNFAAPRLVTDHDVVAKVVVTTAYGLDVHRERFVPDRTILFLRDPRDTLASLRTKPYRNHSGLMDEKFALMDRIFLDRDRYDAVIHYEDFVARDPRIVEEVRALGWPVTDACFTFHRSWKDIFRVLFERVPRIMETMDMVVGGVRGAKVECVTRGPSSEEREALTSWLRPLCPRLLRYYETTAARAAWKTTEHRA